MGRFGATRAHVGEYLGGRIAVRARNMFEQPFRNASAKRAGRHKALITVRPVECDDAPAWLRLRTALWPDGSEDHSLEIVRFFAGHSREPLAVLLAEDSAGDVVGVAELSIRPFAEGCRTDRVAYLEGWYVVPEARRQGVGRSVMKSAEAWARAQGCTEFASDSEPGNEVSAAAHRALGFAEIGMVLCFRKDLSEGAGFEHGSAANSIEAPVRHPMKASLRSVTPLVPAGGSLAAALAFYTEHLGFSILWKDEGMAGVERDGVSFNLVVNDSRVWADNASFSIGVTDLALLYEEYRGIPARVGSLERKPWGRLEFHVIVPSGVCLQFYQQEGA